jgi:hypothetical protein
MIDENSGEYLQNNEKTNILDDELNEIVSKKFKKLLSFFAFLFSKSFEIQFEAFATGHIDCL